MNRKAIGVLVGEDPNAPTLTFYPCTATVVPSAAKSLIIAAAHCVSSFTPGKLLYTNYAFAPEHSGPICPKLACGTNPDGVWYASSSDVLVGPGFPGKQRFDFAFIRLHPDSSNRLAENVVGSITIEFNGPTNGKWRAFGYPHGDPTGPAYTYASSFKSCEENASTTDQVPGDGPPALAMKCSEALTEGSSGGPWVDAATGKLGAVNKAFGSNTVEGIYLGDDAQRMYQQASTSTAPSGPLITSTSAGYRVSAPSVTEIRTHWIVPSLQANPGTGMNFAISVGSWNGDQQDGPNLLMMYVLATVDVNATVKYQPLYAYVPSGSGVRSVVSIPVTVTAGQDVQGDLQYVGTQTDGSATWKLSLANTTTGQSWQDTVQGSIAASNPTFDIGPDTDAGFAEFATFSPVRYISPQVRVGGDWMNLAAMSAEQTEMQVDGVVVAQVQSTGSNAFVVARVGA